MAYDFQKLADVELLEEVPDGASAFVAVNGDVKRVPGSGLGGGGIATAILRFSSESNDSENAVTRREVTQDLVKIQITCDNYTYAQARAILEAGDPFAAMIYAVEGNMHGWSSFAQVILSDNYIMFIDYRGRTAFYWNSDGFFKGDTVNPGPN